MAVSVPYSGELKTPCKIFKYVQNPLDFEPNNDNQEVELIKQVWCKFEPVGAQLFFETAQLSDSVTHRIWVRYVKGLTDVVTITNKNIVLLIDDVYYKVKRATDLDNHSYTMLELTAQYVEQKCLI